MGGPDDQLKIVLDNFKKLQDKETLCGVIDNLKISHATLNLTKSKEFYEFKDLI